MYEWHEILYTIKLTVVGLATFCFITGIAFLPLHIEEASYWAIIGFCIDVIAFAIYKLEMRRWHRENYDQEENEDYFFLTRGDEKGEV